MKTSQIIFIGKFLGNVRLNKIEDKELRSAVIGNHLLLHKLVSGFESDIEELRKSLVKGLEEEMAKLGKAREAYRTAQTDEAKAKAEKNILACKSALAAEQKYVEAYNEILMQEHDVSLKKVDPAAFVDVLSEQGIDITAAELTELDPLF